MKFYTSFDELPVFNYSQMIKTGDLCYLIADKNHNSFNIKKNKALKIKLSAIYQKLLLTRKNIDLKIQVLYFEVLTGYNSFIENETKKTEQTYNDKFFKYLNYLNRNYFLSDSQDDDYSILEYYNDFKKGKDFAEIYGTRWQVFYYNSLNLIPIQSIDLIEEVAIVSAVLGFNINEFETSVTKFELLKKLAAEKSKQNNPFD